MAVFNSRMSSETEFNLSNRVSTNDVPSTASVSGPQQPISRRRAAFRPPRPTSIVGLQSSSTVHHETGATPLNPTNESATGTSTAPSESENKQNEESSKRKGKMWSHDEIMMYYEGLKQCGKDFDGIAKFLGRRKVSKEREQIRNFYYNSVKQIRTISNLDIDDRFPELCRDAKELFLAINGCEWRKRTLSHKYQPERLRELLLDGNTIIRSKKRAIQVKTPPCPALSKYFQMNRRVDKSKLRSDVIIQLSPLSNQDRAYVVDCEQNPFVRMRLSVNEPIGRIFTILQTKWVTPLDKVASSQPNVAVKLRPSATTSVGKVVFTEAAVESQVVSLNKLADEIRVIQKACSQQVSNIPYSTVTSYSAIVPNPFSLNEQHLLDGLTLENVKGATVVELYCLCGMTSTISLIYSIDIDKRQPALQVWNIFSSLMTREYGEAISGYKDEESRKRGSDSVTGGAVDEDQPPPKAASRTSRRPSTNVQRSASIRPASTPEGVSKIGSLNSFVPMPHSNGPRCIDVIIEDQEKLRRQVELLQAKKASKRSRRTAGSSQVPKPALIPAIKKPEDNRGQAVDFSGMGMSCGLMDSLSTPDKNLSEQATFDGDRRKSEVMRELFGEMSRSPIAARQTQARSRRSRSINDQMEQLFGGDVSLTPSKGYTQISGALSSDSIQGCVDSAMKEMMSQDSVDFLQTFQPLVDSFGNEK